ncbi:MAG: LysM peptidoglycan-binding domain-containing protein [bacterium]
MFDRYKVKKDDTLSLIAKKFDTTEDYLKSINDLYYVSNLTNGMDIIVPKNKDKYYDVIKINNPGSVSNISEQVNVNPKLFASMNGLDIQDYIYKNQEVLVPKKNYSYYITSEGDTLQSISEIFDISKNRLLSQNEVIYLLADQIIVNKKIKE